MAKLQFEVQNTLLREETKVTEKGKEKQKVLKFKTVADKSVVIQLSVQGAIDVIDQLFLSFPLGAQGIEYDLTLATTQTTLQQSVAKVQDDKEKKKAQANGTTPIDFDKLDKELDLADKEIKTLKEAITPEDEKELVDALGDKKESIVDKLPMPIIPTDAKSSKKTKK
jgi:hypothetical protein